MKKLSDRQTRRPPTDHEILPCPSERGPFFLPGSQAGCLLIHGLTGTAAEMRHLGESLHRAHGFSVRGTLLAGHGSSPEVFEAHGWPDWLGSAEQDLERLREQCSRIFVAGFSMGGLLAMLLALRHEATVQGLALLATPLFASPLKARLASLFWHVPGVRAGIRRSAARLQAGILPARPDLTPAQASFAQLKWILRREAARLGHPTLVIHSRKDPSVPWQNARALSALLGPACSRTLLLSRSGHVLPLDVDRDLVAEAIGEHFLGLPEKNR